MTDKPQNIIRCAPLAKVKHLRNTLPGTQEDDCSQCGIRVLLAPSSVAHRDNGDGVVMCMDCTDQAAAKDTHPIAFIVDLDELHELHDRRSRRN